MASLERLALADQRVHQDFAEKQEDAGCRVFLVSLVLKVKEALPAKQVHRVRMERTVSRETLAKTAIREKMAKTDCLARMEQMVKMAWMESMDFLGDQAKSGRVETLDHQDVSALHRLFCSLSLSCRITLPCVLILSSAWPTRTSR
jgi:hypothetical protein